MTRAKKSPTSGKGTLKLALTNLTIPFGELTLTQVLTTDALVRYTWEHPTPATEFEPPDYGSFDIVSIRVQADTIFCDSGSIATCRVWKNSEMLEVLSDEQIDALTLHCEALVKSNKIDTYTVQGKLAQGKRAWYHEDKWRSRALELGYRVETVDKFRSKE